MMEYMEHIEPGENVPLATGIKNFCVRNTGKGIFILITDLMDKEGYDKALRFLVAQQMDVYVIHVLCPEEISPDLKGDLKLVDCEDNDHGRSHRQPPAAGQIQADPRQLHRRRPRLLQPPRHELPDDQH